MVTMITRVFEALVNRFNVLFKTTFAGFFCVQIENVFSDCFFVWLDIYIDYKDILSLHGHF